MNILITGLGAIGLIYATRLKDSGLNPKILVDEKRYERYLREGRYYNGKRYDFDYIEPNKKDYKADLIIIAVKANNLEEVLNNLKNFVDKKTIILSLLNGISSEKKLRERYTEATVLDSYYVGHASMRTENYVTHDETGTIVFSGNEKVEKIFKTAGIDYKIPQDMKSSMWQKFIINIGVNQTTALLNQPYLCFKQNEAREIAKGLMAEGVEIAKALKISGHETFIENTFKLIDDMPSECKTSMQQDIEKGRTTEVDIFAGEICRKGKELGILTPKNEIVYQIIKSIEKRLD